MLSQARNIPPITGEETGTCCICGKHTTQGHPKKFGGNFSSADYLVNGEVICQYCKILVDNSNEYRRTMYLLTPDEYIPFKKQEAKDIVFNQLPKDKPFYLYLTKTWQKIGWIRMNHVYNHDKNDEIKVLCDYEIITFKLENLKRICEFIESLRDLKISKNDLETGHFEMYNFNKIKEQYGIQKARNIVNKIKEYTGNPIWDLALYLAK